MTCFFGRVLGLCGAGVGGLRLTMEGCALTPPLDHLSNVPERSFHGGVAAFYRMLPCAASAPAHSPASPNTVELVERVGSYETLPYNRQ